MLTETQQAIRRTGLTGTDVVALAVPDEAWTRPIDVYQAKVDGPQPREETKGMRWGTLFESVVAKEWARVNGYKLMKLPTLRHTERLWQIGTPDFAAYLLERAGLNPPPLPRCQIATIRGFRRKGAVPTPDEALEVKTHSLFMGKRYGEEGTDAVPAHVHIQGDWYLSLMELPRIFVPAIHNMHQDGVWVIERDLAHEANLLELAHDFWTRHVLARRPPDPDGSEAFSRYLQQTYKVSKAELLPATPEQREALTELRQIKERIKEDEARKAIIEQEIKGAIGAYLGLSDPDDPATPLVTWKPDRVGSISHTKLRDALFTELGLTDIERTERIDASRGTPSRRFLLK